MNSTNEQLQEKKSILEQELKKVHLELAKVLNLNDTLALENKLVDETIGKKEQQLVSLQEKDSQEADQYLQERTCLSDSFAHEVNIMEDSIKKLENMKNRYDNLGAENKLLSESMEKIKKKMSTDSSSHATLLHNINRNMRTMRQEMEATFRKELVEMDLHFQRQAFEAMNDEKKKAMLANSKLKDELALQSVGISNLGVRSGRDKQSYKDIKQKMKNIGQHVSARRTKLSDLQMKKMRSSLNICTCESELKIARDKESSLKVDLDRWPTYEELDDAEAFLEKAVEYQQYMFNIWTARIKKTKVLESDFKRSNFGGKLSGQTSISKATAATLGDPPPSLPCADTLGLLKDSDFPPELEEALKPISGKEASLLPSEGTVSECVSQIIDILKSVPLDSSGASPNQNMLYEVDPGDDHQRTSEVKAFVKSLHNIIELHVADVGVTSGGVDNDTMSQITERSAMSAEHDFDASITGDGKWLEGTKSFENILAISNVVSIGSDSKQSKTKYTNVFLPEGVRVEPPVVSNDLLERARLASSAPNLHSKSILGADDVSVVSKKSRRSSKRETDPLSCSKVRHSKTSLNTVTLRAKDSKTEKIIRLMARTSASQSS